ncbi:ABC transporter substrate-binding protein [Carnobacterium viridans]|uniref:Carbohydrate ABC transporter substrate-binding protein, CUT1 family n=1 Tax=Carnobacterium viridans TaxID=174587 RepID=A0A1H0ZE13_9LACT|nr:ABC transporter substrate-binding protein [Carnobacterium viridans]UDE94678.1 ABC transporter substrate-binding protein [Carnobacterium viridans]SDQ25633.1 carbohydrate ABC transporter substrate-binding protein, CUT1 family [Carnobacterium viridans]
MKKKSFMSLLALTATTALTLAACGGTSTADSEETAKTTDESTVSTTATGEGQSITFWHAMGGEAGVALEEIVADFNKENDKGITVTSEFQGTYDDTITKLKSASLGNMGADLVQIYEIGSRYMMDSDFIIPMQEFVDNEGYDLSQIEPNIAAYYTVDDSLYSMPFNSSTPVVYYNKDMFENAGIENAPETLAEIGEMQEALTTDGGADMAISLQIYGWFIEQFTSKQGLEFVNNGNGRDAAATEVEFVKNDAMVNILTEWNELYESGAAPNVGRQGGQPEFVAGQSAMTIGSTASLKTILNEVDGEFEVGTAYLPAISETDEGGVSIGGASLWALDNEDPEKAQAVWEFTKYMISPEVQAEWNKATGYFPITTAAHEEEVFKNNIAEFPQFQTAIDQLHDSNPESQGAFLSVYPEARQIVEKEIENMLNGAVTPEAAATAMEEQINTAIENYNLVNEAE